MGTILTLDRVRRCAVREMMPERAKSHSFFSAAYRGFTARNIPLLLPNQQVGGKCVQVVFVYGRIGIRANRHDERLY